MRIVKYAVLAMIMFVSFASRGESVWNSNSISTYEVTTSGGGREYVTVRDMTPQMPATQSSGNSGSSGGCYIATAVYGSYDCPQVWTLRRYRDDMLASTPGGRCFIQTYYAISPTLVRWFGQNDCFINTSKRILDKMVQQLNETGVSNLPYADKQW